MRDIIHWSFISSPSMSHSISTLFQSPWDLKFLHPNFFDLFIPLTLWPAPLHLLLLRVHSIPTFLCNVYNPTSSSERYMMSMTRPSSSPLITCSFHPNLSSLPLQSTIPHPWYLWPALLHVLLRVHTISTLQQPHIILWSLHSMMSMTCDIRYARYNRLILHLFSYLGYLKFLHPKFFYLFIPFSLINSSYYVFIPSQPFLTSSAMSTIPHVPLSDPWCLRPVLLHLLLLVHTTLLPPLWCLQPHIFL